MSVLKLFSLGIDEKGNALVTEEDVRKLSLELLGHRSGKLKYVYIMG